MVLGISGWDWVTLVIYFVGITGIGLYMALKVKDTEDFFMAGRRFGKVFMMFFAFGAGTSGNDAVGVSAKTYTNGVSGIWYQWLWLFATPFYWLIAPVFRRMRAITTGDYFEYRYDASVGVLYTFVGIFQLTVNMGVLLFGAGSTIAAVTNAGVNVNLAILFMTVLFVVYGIAGGLAAAIVTDFIQGILTIILSFIILPFAWSKVGGMAGLRESVTNENMFSLVAPGEINAFHILMMAASALIGIVTQPHIMGVCASGRTEMDGRFGFAGGNLLKRVCTVAWTLTGLCAVAYYAGRDIVPDQIYGNMAAELLPAVMPGLVGVFIAALLASIMSSCDAFMVSCSGLFTQNVYRRFLAPGRDEKHYVLIGRIAALVIVVMSVSFAFAFDSVPDALETFFKIQAMMGAAFWMGLFWRRATVLGAWIGTIAGFIVMMGSNAAWFHGFAVENLPEFMVWDEKFRYSWQVFSFLSASFLTCFVVSLLTPRVPKAQLDKFFDCLRTPVGHNEPHLAPFTLPEGVEVGPPNKLIDHPDLEIPKPSLVGIGGFVVIWGIVGLMIGFMYWIMGTGV